jgi:hypothetical protein
MTFTWYGKPREELTREELYQVIDHLSRDMHRREESLRSVIDIQSLAMKRIRGAA